MDLEEWAKHEAELVYLSKIGVLPIKLG